MGPCGDLYSNVPSKATCSLLLPRAQTFSVLRWQFHVPLTWAAVTSFEFLAAGGSACAVTDQTTRLKTTARIRKALITGRDGSAKERLINSQSRFSGDAPSFQYLLDGGRDLLAEEVVARRVEMHIVRILHFPEVWSD